MRERKFAITTALYSTRSLIQHLDELTEEEVLAALKLETGSRRRSVITEKLIQRAVALNSLTYAAQLQEKQKCPVQKV